MERQQPIGRGRSSTPDPRVARSRSKVLDAVTELLRERGTAGVTVDAVISRSGVARSTIYRHWSTRADLVSAALQAMVPDTSSSALPEDRVRSVSSGPDALRARLRPVLVTFIGAAGTDTPAGLVPLLLVEADRDPELADVRRRLLDRLTSPLASAVRPAMEDGTLPPSLTVQDATAWLLGPLLVQRFLAPEGADEAFVDRTVDAFLTAHVVRADAHRA